jgi:hypothetical protein
LNRHHRQQGRINLILFLLRDFIRIKNSNPYKIMRPNIEGKGIGLIPDSIPPPFRGAKDRTQS